MDKEASHFFFKIFHNFIYFSFIFQYFIDFELIIIICFVLFFFPIRLLQFQTNILYLVDTQFLQAFIFIIISLNKKWFKKYTF
jgi:hypothetical protein